MIRTEIVCRAAAARFLPHAFPKSNPAFRLWTPAAAQARVPPCHPLKGNSWLHYKSFLDFAILYHSFLSRHPEAEILTDISPCGAKSFRNEQLRESRPFPQGPPFPIPYRFSPSSGETWAETSGYTHTGDWTPQNHIRRKIHSPKPAAPERNTGQNRRSPPGSR